jgi:hypothetical protein
VPRASQKLALLVLPHLLAPLLHDRAHELLLIVARPDSAGVIAVRRRLSAEVVPWRQAFRAEPEYSERAEQTRDATAAKLPGFVMRVIESTRSRTGRCARPTA